MIISHHCVLCAAPCRGRDLCTGCHGDLPWVVHACARCARPLEAPDRMCGPCIRRPPPQHAAFAPLAYGFPVDRLLLKLKFGRSLPPGRVLGELLAENLRGASRRSHLRWPDVLVPVPLHPRRQRERGFNQALEIARPVARSLAVPMCPRACRRVLDTPAQSTLVAAQRRRNLRRAFLADAAAVAGLHVALVDDVYTTGSTIAAAARALLEAGASRVEAWCVARA